VTNLGFGGRLLIAIFLCGITAFTGMLASSANALLKQTAYPRILYLELAPTPSCAKKVVTAWAKIANEVRRSIYWDFAFIVCYAANLWFLSSWAAIAVPSWRQWAIAFAFFALTAGALDFIEDFGMLVELNGTYLWAVTLPKAIASAIKWLLVTATVVFDVAAFVRWL